MTILFFTRLFYPHIGGVETHTYKVCQGLIDKGHKIIVVTEQYDKPLPIYEIYDGIEIYRIPINRDEKGKKIEVWQWLFKHKDLIGKTDIVHCHDVFFWYLPFRFIYPSKKVFTTFHGYETVFPLKRKAIVLRRLSEKLSMGNICVGDFIKKWYGTRPTFVTYGGVDNIKKVSINFPKREKKIKILFAGRINEDTGVNVYAEVLEILRNKKIKFEFIAIGDGPEKKLLSRFGDLKGFVSNPGKYIKEADIVFTSSYLTILLALVNKKLVIATYTNPLKKDYLAMSPFAKWLIIDRDPIQLTHKVVSYIENNKEYANRIEQAHKWATTQTWEKVTNTYLTLWKIE